jgi:hypothetical protein
MIARALDLVPDLATIVAFYQSHPRSHFAHVCLERILVSPLRAQWQHVHDTAFTGVHYAVPTTGHIAKSQSFGPEITAVKS